MELEYEKDKQLHLKDTGHKSYNAEILKRITKRLATFQVNQQIQKDSKWIHEFVLPRLNAHGRKGQRLSEHKKPSLNENRPS